MTTVNSTDDLVNLYPATKQRVCFVKITPTYIDDFSHGLPPCPHLFGGTVDATANPLVRIASAGVTAHSRIDVVISLFWIFRKK